MLQRTLLGCGIVGSLLYVATDFLAALYYPEYHSFSSRAVSELMANGAPTEGLVDPLFMIYNVVMLAFALGVWRSQPTRRAHVTAGLLFAYAAIGFTGPTLFEMNVRGSAASNADLLHIVVTALLVLSIFFCVASGAALGQRAFRRYSLATVLIMLVSGVLTSFASRGLATGEPTPWLGTLERINIGAFLLWIVVLARVLLRAAGRQQESRVADPASLRPPAARDGAETPLHARLATRKGL